MRERKVFQAQKNTGIHHFAIMFPIAMGIARGITGGHDVERIILEILLYFVIMLMILALTCTVKYTFTEESFLIQTRLLRTKVYYNRIGVIRELTGTATPATPGQQQLKLYNKEGKKLVTVAPMDIEGFEKELRERISK